MKEADLNAFLLSEFEEASIEAYAPNLPEPIDSLPLPSSDSLRKLSLHSYDESCGIERFHECRPLTLPWVHLNNFVPYSPLLETLNLDANAGPVVSIIKLLRHCPRLKTFSFAVVRDPYADYIDWIWDALTLDRKHSLVPALERLYIRDETYRASSSPAWMCMLELDSLVQMVHSRKDTLRRLVLGAPHAMFKTSKWDEVEQGIEAIRVGSGFEFEQYWGYRQTLYEDGEFF